MTVPIARPLRSSRQRTARWFGCWTRPPPANYLQDRCAASTPRGVEGKISRDALRAAALDRHPDRDCAGMVGDLLSSEYADVHGVRAETRDRCARRRGGGTLRELRERRQ